MKHYPEYKPSENSYCNRILNKELVDDIVKIAEKFDYKVEISQPFKNMKQSDEAYYDLYFNHKTNERLNFNAYGDTLLDIEDAIYWHCENGMENHKDTRLTKTEANYIMKIRNALIDFYKTLPEL